MEDIAEYLHVTVRMLGKTPPGSNNIIIDHAQASEAHVSGVVVIGKAESVAAAEPSMVRQTAFGGRADGDEGLGDGTGHIKRLGTIGLKNLAVLASESFKTLNDLPWGELTHIATEPGDLLHDS